MRGIIFTESNFHLTVQGIKKQTRRIVHEKVMDKYFDYDDWCLSVGKPEGVSCTRLYERDFLPRYSRYKVGEIVYLKEPYFTIKEDGVMNVVYKYGNDQAELWEGTDDFRWDNKLYMPERYARYFIKITSVRVERLQDISEEDCLLEGIERLSYDPDCPELGNVYYAPGIDSFWTAREAYAALIDNINGAGTWESNPFVWVYDYELTKK